MDFVKGYQEGRREWDFQRRPPSVDNLVTVMLEKAGGHRTVQGISRSTFEEAKSLTG